MYEHNNVSHLAECLLLLADGPPMLQPNYKHLERASITIGRESITIGGESITIGGESTKLFINTEKLETTDLSSWSVHHNPWSICQPHTDLTTKKC